MSEQQNRQTGIFIRTFGCIMTAIALFTSAWAGSTTIAYRDIQRLSTQQAETQAKTQEIDKRVYGLEKGLDQRLTNIEDKLDGLIKTHTARPTP